MDEFEKAIMKADFQAMLKNKTLDEKVLCFHQFLRSNLDKYLPKKTAKMTNIDREWMTPELKQLQRAMQKECYKKRKSEKFKKLKSKFKKLKRKTL